MNAPVAAALLAARAVTPAKPAITQPAVPADLICLMCNYLHDDLHLDLYGFADEDDGCSVEAVTLAGHNINVSALIKPEQFKQMSWAVDRAAVRARAMDQAQARAERAVFDLHCVV
ncbi:MULTISPECIES: hypothetical protein [unclassified Duganella]|uniref:hypothetical protein n=1 Tax=unclassified Duganella TaxID=2636909 RepID=UPI000882CF3B|nr:MULTISPECIES: hypothetical protein [unclassified Duganella]SDF79956.1 hypothetical protein SAMN05216320_1011360 [Duganella sp. OV458]SDI49211.1 hypothetical protein SAMN05428973_10155 [Duganella sp. OV510]